MFIARVLYQCLTGSLPPSDQVPESLADESPVELGFDHLLMNWVTEERDLGVLGAYALQALHGAESDDGIIDFIRTIYPHLQQASQLAVNDASQQLASERRLLQSVEKHRSTLKELRTRHQYLSGWLIDQQPELAQGTKVLEDTQTYVQDFQDYAQTVGERLKYESRSDALAVDLKATATPTTLPLSFSELVDDVEEKFEIKPRKVSEASSLAQTSGFGSVHVESESMFREDLDRAPVKSSSAVKLFVLVVLVATLLGVLFAWSLLSATSHPKQSDDSVFYQRETK